jgi:hypothetical protein
MFSATSAAVGTLTWNQSLIAVGIVAAAVLLAGLVVIFGRGQAAHKDPSASVVRSWIAVSLVIGLLLFGVFAFAVDDTTLRSTLIGSLSASVGAAIAFYFSSKSSDQARQDLLNATFGTETTPDLAGKTEAEATALLGKSSLKLEVDPASTGDATAVVVSQVPVKGSSSRKGDSVLVTLGPPT